jgi:TP901 family phage tail tape measure protein
VRLAAAQQAEATSALQAARAQSIHASQLGFVSRGAGATGLSLLGVRGATLAANASFLAGAAAVAVFAKSVRLAAGLEEELNVFRVTAKATAEEIERVREASVALGRDVSLPAVSAGDAAQAMTELAKAGLDVEDSIAGARGVLQLAAAAQLDNAQATELAATALNAFGLAGDQAVHVADLLANAANEAQGSIADMGLSLTQSAAVARQVGLSLDQTIALLTILARAGLQGSDAGTSLRTSLTRLIAPTEKASDQIERLNIDLRDAQGNLRPDVFAQLGRAMENLGKQDQARILFRIFGQDAQRAAAILAREGVPALNEVTIALSRQGAATELAGARAVGLSGQVSALESNLETLGTSLATVVLPPLESLVSDVNDITSAANTAVTALSDLGSEAKDLGDSFLDAVPGSRRLLEGLQEISRFASPLTASAEAARLLSRRFGDSAEQIQGDAQDTTREVRNLFAVFREQGAGAVALNELVVKLDQMADSMAEGDAEAQRLSRVIREVIREIQNFGNLPPTVIDIEARLDPVQARREGERGGDEITAGLRLAGGAIEQVGIELMDRLGEGMKSETPRVAEEVGEILIPSLTTQISVAEATGTENELLRLLREREARQSAFLERLLGRPQDAKTQQLVQKAAANLKRTQDQIESIERERANRAKESRNKIIQARKEADQAFLDAIGAREGRLQNQLLIASATETLADDIRAQTALRAFYRRSLEEAKKTLRDAKARADAIAEITRELIRVNLEIRRLRQEQQESLREERRRERRERLERQRELAQTTGDTAAERRALEAEIDFYRRRIRATRRGSVERKRWILELRRAQQELKELQGETDKTGRAQQQVAFEFLQMQQGFAANLLSNLLPGGAAAGTVGGQAAPPIIAPVSPAAAAAREAGIIQAREGGISAGQMSTLIALTRQMLLVLKDVHRGTGHPEARYQRISTGAALELLG